MSRQNLNPFVLLIIGLAAFGLVFRLVTDPLGLFTQLLLYAAIAFGIYFLYKRFMAKRMGAQITTSHRHKSFKNKTPNRISNVVPHKRNNNMKKASVKPLQKRRTEHNLTVIEGKKNKKKNRALF